MTTNMKSNTKFYETIGFGEVSNLKKPNLRNIKMEFFLPNDINLPFLQKKYTPNCIIDKPLKYLNMLRMFKENAKPFRLLIARILPNGEEIFKTNIKVSLEDYTVFEMAGEEGDFTVELNLKEFKDINNKIIVPNSNGEYTIQKNRSSKDVPKTYIVKKGDTLWNIAKREFNDEKLYKKLMQINNISEPKNLKVGTILKLA